MFHNLAYLQKVFVLRFQNKPSLNLYGLHLVTDGFLRRTLILLNFYFWCIMAIYKAWVPNVSGTISFSNIKGSSIPRRVRAPTTTNGLDSGENLITYQERNLSDKPFSRFDEYGVMCYLLIAKTENIGVGSKILTGKILTYPKYALPEDQKKTIKYLCNRGYFSKNKTDLWCALAEDWLKESSVCIEIFFCLEENGFVTLEHADEKNSYLNESLKSTLIFESFSFLKDLVHSHKFHNSDHDSIVVPYLLSASDASSWIKNSIENIHKAIICTYRNSRRSKDIKNAIGMLAYLTSLQNIAKKAKVLPEYSEVIDTNSLQSSLEAKRMMLESVESNRSAAFYFFIPTYFAAVGIIISMAQLLQVPCIYDLQDSETIKKCPRVFYLQSGVVDFVEGMLSGWFWWVTISSLVFFFSYSYSRRDDVLSWIDENWSSDFFGGVLHVLFGTAALGKRWQILVTILVIILLCILAFFAYLLVTYIYQL